MRVVCLFSGGKDSTYAAQWAMKNGYEVILLNVRPEPYSMMFHHQNVKWTEMQAEALGLSYSFIEVDENNWERKIKEKIEKLKIDGIVSGAVASNYQKDRIDKIAEELSIKSYAPLWHATAEVFEEMVNTMEIYITGVAAEGMGKELLGKRLTGDFKHPKYVHTFFEGGEAETFVANAPLFKKRIVIDEWEIKWDGVRGSAEIKKAYFENKL
ncbi:MAG: diphthine--ammonia ligase [Candidatus Bilamarchaeaceae archaeon]